MTYDEFKQNFLPEFIKIKTFAGKIKFAGQYLQRIGSGSGRIVYDIDGEKVLKLAKNTKGVAQNEIETGIGYYHDTQHIVTIIFDSADNNEWLIAEKGKKVTEARIKQLTGIPSLSELYMYLKNFHSSNNGEGNIFGQDQNIKELLNENEFVQDLQNFIANYNQSPGDFGRPSTYGEVLRNGEPTIVLTDYGLNDEVYDTHYSGKPKQHGYRMYELYNFADGNDDILGDMPPQDAVDTRQGMWALMPYGVGDGPGVINEDFISFVLNRDKYPTRPLPSTPYILDEFHDIINNLKEVLNHVSDKKKFYNNLLELQNYLIRGKFYDREPLEKENIITEEEMVNEDVLGVPKEVADNIANTVAQKLNFGTPNHIGDGTFGYAYDIGNNIVLKVTKDQSEANKNLELIGKPLEHIAKPYKVFSIKSSTISKELYVIILEKLKTDLAKFIAAKDRLNFAFKKIMDVNYEDVVDYYVNGHSPGLNVNESMVQKYMQKNPIDAEFFYAIIEIGKELKKYGIKSMDYVTPSNLGYKPNGSLGFFDVGFGDFYFKSENQPEEIKIDEDGSSLFSTDNSFGQDNFPVHNNIDTSPSIQNDLNANSSLYEDLEYNHVVGDATEDEFEISERKLSSMDGSSTVEVKKKCRLGGLGNTSVACNQGDINNLDIKPLTEAQNQEFLGYNNDLDQIEKQQKEYQDRAAKIFAETNRKYLQPYLSKEEMDIVVDWVVSQNKSGDRENDENAYNLRNKASDELNKDNPGAGAEFQVETKKYLNLSQKLSKFFIKKKFGLHKKYPSDNRFGVAGDVNVTEVSHFSTTGGAIGILNDGYIMENEEGGVSTTTNKNLVKDIKPVFYHPQSSGYEGISYKNLSIQFVLDFNKIKADGVKFRKGDENRGTHIGEEEIRIYPKDGELDIYVYLKRVIIDPTKEKNQKELNKLVDILKGKNIQYFVKNNLKSITEEINPKEITDDNKAIKAVLSGKRDVGFIELNLNNSKLIKKNNLGIFPVRMVSQNSMMVIIYRDKIKAQRLLDIANSHSGYLSDKSPDEAREIGKLLGYMDASIEEYIRRKYGNKPPILPDKSPDDYDDLAEDIQDEGVADTYGEKLGVEHPNANFEKQFNKEKNVENQEEYVGSMIKNPKSLANLGMWARGIIDREGNLYVEQNSDNIHQYLLEELKDLGIISHVDNNWHLEIPDEFITVQRYENTNKFMLGESNVLLKPKLIRRQDYQNLIDREEALPLFQKFLDLAKPKNPQIEFINELIYFGIPEINENTEEEFPEFEKQVNKDNITHELDKVLIKVYKDSDDIVNVYTVNGDEVRDSGFIEWVDGGNHWVDVDLPDDEQKYAKHIPADEVWIDDVFLSKPNDLEAIVLHERVESYLIKHYGYSYDNAHEIANKIESVYRRKTKGISDGNKSEGIASLAYIAFKKKFDKNNKRKKIVNENNGKSYSKDFDKAICKNIQLTPEIQEYLKKFNSDEELLRSGGIPTVLLDRAAFGFDDTIKQLMPNQLSIKWKDDFDNVKFGIKKKGLTNLEYAKSVSLEEPIDVSFDGKKFNIEDGHHRFYAAKILNKPLNVNLEIKANPIAVLGGDMEYDDFHRCAWNQVHNLSEGAVHARLNEYPGQMDKVYVRPGIYDQEDRDAIMSITGGDAYTKLIADMFYYLTNRYNKKEVKPTKLSGKDRELLVKAHQRLREYDKNVIPIHDLYAQEHNAHPLEKMNDLDWRELIIGRIKQLPSVLVRNLKNDIRKERNYYELKALYNIIKDIQNSIKLIGRVKPEHREKIEKKIYSSANDTFEAVKKRLEDTTIPYLSQDDAVEGIIEKVNDLGDEAEVLYQGNNKLIVKINTGEAMAYIGCSSQWCFATNPQGYWDNYVSDSGFATIVFDFDEPESEPNRMLVVLEDGQVYDMYNELVEDGQDYLYNLGVAQYILEPQEELAENVEVNEDVLDEAQIMSLQDLPFKQDIEQVGGKTYSIGGAVRDEFLGKESKDLDVLITGVPLEQLEQILSKYGRVDAVGKSFGVLKFKPKGATEEIDIAIPRSETPTGEGGHKGFDVKSDHTLPIEADQSRRDFTINAIAKDTEGNIIDPYNGREDIKNKIIRVVNPQAFSDDPLRMLRGISFASRFGFTIEPETMKMIIDNVSRVKEIAPERILTEFDKIIKKGDKRIGAQLLKDTGLFTQIFGYDLNQSTIDRSPFEDVRTMGEFIFLLSRLLPNPAEFYKNNLKGDISTFKEIKALEMAYNSGEATSSIEGRSVAHNMYVTSPQSLESQILPNIIKTAANELLQGKYPKTVNELAVNGNDLISLGLKGKEIADTQKMLLLKIYADKAKNNREELLNLAKNLNGQSNEVKEGVADKYVEKEFNIPDQNAVSDVKAMKYMQTSTEKPFGLIISDDGREDLTPAYKNPKSLTNFGGSVRALADGEGNLYVALEDGEFNHGAMGESLGLSNYNGIYHGSPTENDLNFVLLHRVGKTNTFGLSDSSNYDRKWNKIRLERIKNILHLTKRKNPQYTFYLDYFQEASDDNSETINESKSDYTKTKDSILKSKSIDKEMKQEILKHIGGGSTYHEGGRVHGLIKPKELLNKTPKIDGVSLGADKDGFFVYTHRQRSKSYELPEKIPIKEIEFTNSTG